MIMMIKAEQIIPILFFFYFNMGVTSFYLHKNFHTQTTASPSILITWVCSFSHYSHCWWICKIQIILLSCEWSEESDGSILAPQSAHHHFPHKDLGIRIKGGTFYSTHAYHHPFCSESCHPHRIKQFQNPLWNFKGEENWFCCYVPCSTVAVSGSLEK